MKVEVLIYAYLAVCVAMIGFNIVCIFLFRREESEIEEKRFYYLGFIREQIALGETTEEHRKFLLKKLSHIRGLLAFDKSLEVLSVEEPEKVQTYLHSLDNVFISLMQHYRRRDEIQAAYFPYLIARYQLFRGEDFPQIHTALAELLHSQSVYSRENALNAIYSIGISRNVVEALLIVDNNGYYHHKKLITDGLMSFSGDKDELDRMLWDHLSRFSLNMQLSILDYIRFSSGNFKEEMYSLFSDRYDSEIHYCAIRYFGRYYYEPAYEKLMEFAENENNLHWEYTAITCSSLATYPSERTVEMLKKKLSSRNWYVRTNAAQALERMGLEYADLIDVIQGEDRYAGEIMRYQFDRKKLNEKGGATA